MISPIKTRIRKPSQRGIFHDSRQDVDALAKVCTELINKVNELTDEVNRLNSNKNNDR